MRIIHLATMLYTSSQETCFFAKRFDHTIGRSWLQWQYSGTSHNGPYRANVYQPPKSGRFLIPDSGQAACSHNWPTNGQTGTTPIFHAGI